MMDVFRGDSLRVGEGFAGWFYGEVGWMKPRAFRGSVMGVSSRGWTRVGRVILGGSR